MRGCLQIIGIALAFTMLLVAANSNAQPESLGNKVNEWSDRIAQPGLVRGSKIAIEDEPCCSSSANAHAKDPAEAAVLATIPNGASRDGKTLRLKLDGGRTIKLVDCDESICPAAYTRVHRLTAYWPQYRFYVISVGYYEGGGGLLIDESNGDVISVVVPPVLSPDGRYAIAWDPSLENDRKVRMEWLALGARVVLPVTPGQCPGRTEYAHPGPKPVWLSEEEIAFDHSEFLINNSPQFRMTLRIVGGLNLIWKCEF